MTAFKGFGELSRPIGRRVVLGGLAALPAGLDAAAMGRRPPRDTPDQTRWNNGIWVQAGAWRQLAWVWAT